MWKRELLPIADCPTSCLDFEDDIQVVIDNLSAIRRIASERGYRNVAIEVGFDDSFSVTGERLETDKEAARREKRAESAKLSRAKAKRKKAEAELREYVRLSKKYGSSG